MHPASRTPPSAADQNEALALAARYHLVTGVSGAVVLESQGETDAVAAGESERSNVPTVPEPETWALLALVAALLLATLRLRRRLVARTS